MWLELVGLEDFLEVVFECFLDVADAFFEVFAVVFALDAALAVVFELELGVSIEAIWDVEDTTILEASSTAEAAAANPSLKRCWSPASELKMHWSWEQNQEGRDREI